MTPTVTDIIPVGAPSAAGPARRKLPDERKGFTHKFSIEGHEGYIRASYYPPETEMEHARGFGKLGEIFIEMAKEGSTISGLMERFATVTSLALQSGVPLEELVDKMCGCRFEPSGFTKNPKIPIAHSLTDYIFRWLAFKFLSEEKCQALLAPTTAVPALPTLTPTERPPAELPTS